MAKVRTINTKFWDDNYIVTLKPTEKLLFLYFLTNPATEICGAYEIALHRVSYDTGLPESEVKAALAKFKTDKRIYYHDGWVWIPNFIKNQITRSPQVQAGIRNSLEKVPDWVKKGIDTLSIPYPYPMDRVSDQVALNLTKPNLTPKGTPKGVKDEITLLLDGFYEINPAVPYGHKAQREAAAWMIKQEGGFKQAMELVKYLGSIKGKPYAPVITTPVQLKNKYAQLEAYQERQK